MIKIVSEDVVVPKLKKIRDLAESSIGPYGRSVGINDTLA